VDNREQSAIQPRPFEIPKRSDRQRMGRDRTYDPASEAWRAASKRGCTRSDERHHVCIEHWVSVAERFSMRRKIFRLLEEYAELSWWVALLSDF
jgi:hypothetical protein